jgi:hypothetical protein
MLNSYLFTAVYTLRGVHYIIFARLRDDPRLCLRPPERGDHRDHHYEKKTLTARITAPLNLRRDIAFNKAVNERPKRLPVTASLP